MLEVRSINNRPKHVILGHGKGRDCYVGGEIY